MTRTRTLWMAASGLALAIALGALGRDGAKVVDARAGAGGRGAGVAGARAEGPAFRHDLTVGRTRVWKLELAHRAEIDPAALLGAATGAPPKLARLTVAGRLEETVLAAGADEVVLHVVVPDAAVQAETSAEAEAIRAGLAGGVLVRLEPSGRALAFAVPDDAPAAGRRALEYLVALRQLSLPGEAAVAWEREELGPEGATRVRYEREGRHRLRRRPLAVVRPSLAGVTTRPTGELAVELDDGGTPVRVRGELGLVVEAGPAARRVLTASADVDARLLEERDGAPWSPAGFGAWLEFGAPPAPPGSARRADARSVDVAATAARLAGGAPDGDEARRLVGVLVRAGTGEAQAALRDAIDTWRAAGFDVVDHVAALGDLAAPDEATMAFLRGLAADPAAGSELTGAAELAFGTAIGRLAHAAPAQARALAAEVAAELAAGPSPERAHRLLHVLGNAGAPEVLPLARRYLAGDDARLRGAAALALRFVPGDEQDELLVRALAGETDENTRSLITASLAYRGRR